MKKIYLLISAFLCLGLMTAKAQITDIHIFNDTLENGAYPFSSLLLSGNVLYGTTIEGGKNGTGCVFSIQTDGNNYKDILDFDLNGSNGKYPRSSLVIAGNVLYGMTYSGGANSDGNIFSIDTDGNNYTDVFDFNGTDGNNPWGSLLVLGNKLYGVTSSGGANGDGDIFYIDTTGGAGTFKDLCDFVTSTGSSPYGSLTLSGHKFFGMSESGGMYGDGAIFSVDTSGKNYKDLVNLWGTTAPKGSNPSGSLIISGIKLYGMTRSGGANSDGVVFSVDTSGGNYKDMLDFDATNGNSPWGSLLLSDSVLYGMTNSGGTNTDGNIFSIDTSGKIYTDIFSFNGTNGKNPYGSLIYSKGIFYGMTYFGGGTIDSGVIFAYNTCTLDASIGSVVNVKCNGEGTGSAIVLHSGGQAPITFQWSGNGGTKDTAKTLLAGTYTVTVTDNKGCEVDLSATISQPTALTLVHDSVDATGTSCNGFAQVIVSGGTPPYTYVWTPVAQTADSITGQCAGTYNVTVTDSNGCTQSTSIIIGTSSGVNIVGNAPSLNIYPEPNNGYFTIDGVSIGQVIELYDYTGQLLSDVIADNTIMHFTISDKANGLYLIKIVNRDGSLATQEKIIKIQ